MPDLEKLQGAWHLSGAEVDGREVDGRMAQDASIVISGNRFKAVGMGAPYEGTLTLDASKQPARLDMAVDVGHAAGKKHPGIYRVAGDRLILCINMASAERPATFASGPGIALETFVRSRGTGNKRSPSRAAEAPPKAKRRSSKKTALPERVGDPTPIEGEWQMVAGVFNGAPMSQDMVQWCKRVTRGTVTTVLAGPRTMLKAQFTINASTNPREIDYVMLEGPDRGKSALGIVDWSDDSCSINMADAGQPRPKDFHCRKGDKRSFTSWRLLQR